MLLSRSLSDEEKTAELVNSKTTEIDDEYSEIFEKSMEDSVDSEVSFTKSAFDQARSFFIQGQIDSSSELSEPPSLPLTKPPDLIVPALMQQERSVNDRKDSKISIVNSAQMEQVSITPVDSIVHSSDRTDREDAASAELCDYVTKDDSLLVGTPVPVDAKPDFLDVKLDVSDTHKSVDAEEEEVSIISINDTFSSEVIEISDDDSKADSKVVDLTVTPPIKQIDLTATTPVKNDDLAEITAVTKLELSEISLVKKPDLPVNTFSDTPSVKIQDLLVNDSEELTKESQSVKPSEAVDDSVEKTDITKPSPVKKAEHSIDIKAEFKENDDASKLLLKPEDSHLKTHKQDIKSSEEDYPEDLNPFDDDEPQEEVMEDSAKDPLNPFDEDEDEVFSAKFETPKPMARRKIRVDSSDNKVIFSNGDTPIELDKQRHMRISVNPHEDKKVVEAPRISLNPPEASVKKIEAPRISLNPFWSDDEEPVEEDEKVQKPVPTPRLPR